MSKATKRIKEGWHKIERVPEGFTEVRYIYDDGEYELVGADKGKDVFEGGFYNDAYGSIVSHEWLRHYPDFRVNYTLRRFKLIN